MLVETVRGCTFTVPGAEGGPKLERVRAKPGDLLDLPDDVARDLIGQKLVRPQRPPPVDEFALPPPTAAFADATPVDAPVEPEPVELPSNRFEPPQRAGGLRSFIRTPR